MNRIELYLTHRRWKNTRRLVLTVAVILILLYLYHREAGEIPNFTSHIVNDVIKPIEKAINPTGPMSPMDRPLAKTTCAQKSANFVYPKELVPGNIRMEDRFSQIGIKFMAELTHTNMPTPEKFYNPWKEFMNCYEPYTIIYLEAWQQQYLKFLLPKLTVPVILITGDGDTSNPGIDIQRFKKYLPEPGVRKPIIAHWFAQHCRPDAAKYDWITCIPLGINQWLQTREKFQLYAQTYGHLMNPMEGGIPEWKPQENSVLVSFGITKKKVFRKPVWDYFCGEGFKNTGGSASCFFKAVDKDYTFFDVFDAIRKSRWVVSPPGEAIDCYRTYEALLLGSFPIVQSTVLDLIFQDLPVLIVKDLTKVTAKLLEEKYYEFRGKQW
ncbi:hypothetical protein HDV01_003519, partial [Terramyces sp. JEL0728]